MKDATIEITAYDWVPPVAAGQVRDLRLRWALEEAGFPYRVRLIPQGTQGEDANLARQPFGQVPVLTVDGRPMFETGACLWRIAKASPALLPDGAEDRDSCLSWLFGALNSVEPPISMVANLWFFETFPEAFDLEEGAPAAVVRPGALKLARQRLDQVADVLDGRDHLVAGRFTVADLIMTAVLLIADRMDVMEKDHRLRPYYDRHAARPAFRKAQDDQTATIRDNAGKYEAAQ